MSSSFNGNIKFTIFGQSHINVAYNVPLKFIGPFNSIAILINQIGCISTSKSNFKTFIAGYCSSDSTT